MAAPLVQGNITGGFGGVNTSSRSHTVVALATRLVAYICYQQPNGTANSITSITDTNFTWTKHSESHTIFAADGNGTSGSSYCSIEVWHAVCTPGVATTTTFNFSSNVDHCSYTILETSGTNGTQPFDQNASLNNSTVVGTTAAQPSITLSTNTANTLLFAVCGTSSSQQQSLGATFNGAADTDNIGTNFSSGGVDFCSHDGAYKSYTSQQTNVVVQFATSRTNQLTVAFALTADSSTPTGTWNSTDTKDTFTASGTSGTPGTRGDLAATEAKDTFAAVGKVTAVATMAATENPDIFSAFGRQPLTATWASTEAKDQFHATGIGRGVDGTFISSEAVDIFAAVGHTPIASVWASTETPDKFAAFGAGVTATKQRRVFFVT